MKSSPIYLAIVSVVLLHACKNKESSDTQEVVRPVKFIEILAHENTRELSFPAIVKPETSAALNFKVGGQIVEFPISSSQKIKKGQVIAQIDRTPYENKLKSAQSDYDTTKLELDRAKKLLAEDAIAKKIHDQRLGAFQIADTALKSAKEAISYTTLTAPFDGVIASTEVEKFDTIQPGAVIATLHTSGSAKAEIQAPATLVANSRQMEALKSYVVLDARPDVKMPAIFDSASTEADPRTQTFKVTYSFEPDEEIYILPGMTGTLHSMVANTTSENSDKSISIPVSAIVAEAGKTFVWIVDKKSMTVARRSVEVGDSLGERVTIVSGLSSGETIAGAGAPYLTEGMKVSEFKSRSNN